MSPILTKKLQRRKPLITHKLAKEAWGHSDKGLLSKALFKDVIEDVKKFFSEQIQGLSQQELVDLLVDYLRINGYDVANVGVIGEVPCVTSSLITSDGVRLYGYAIATRRWSTDDMKILIDSHPTADFYHVFAFGGIPKELGGKVKLITAESILQIITFIVVFDYFFNEYLHSIIAMPGFKEYIYAYLEEEVGLTTDRIEALDTGWERLRGVEPFI